jgi:hypothetical protein
MGCSRGRRLKDDDLSLANDAFETFVVALDAILEFCSEFRQRPGNLVSCNGASNSGPHAAPTLRFHRLGIHEGSFCWPLIWGEAGGRK